MDYEERYKKLNGKQKIAVEAIDGPVVVLAGPGTGKTELLSMRIANILKKTDVLPNNILCLTFTDSGSRAMQNRLHDIIGNDAYKVAIHTFHSFGTEIINNHSQYFYDGLNFDAADDLTKYEIIENIFNELRYDDPLVNKANTQYIKDISRAISEIKRAGLTFEEINTVLDSNDQSYDGLTPQIREIFASRISNKTIPLVGLFINKIDIKPIEIFKNIFSFNYLVHESLLKAFNEATEMGKAKPITAWKNAWIANDSNKNLIFKSEKTSKILRSVNYIYRRYQEELLKQKKYDFDDMILQVIKAMNDNPDLKYDLQEQYQYILVDEFQDTNLSQMRILYMLADNIANDNKPNILVVGDDDQAIYSFQGAEVNYLMNFSNTFDDTKIITLNDNYRSNNEILEFSRNIIKQGNDRIENIRGDISKELISHKLADKKAPVSLNEYGNIDNECSLVVDAIKHLIVDKHIDPSDIAVIAKKHKELQKISTYFAKQDIAVDYDKQSNVLELEPIKLIVLISNLLCALASNDMSLANSMIYQVITHPSFDFEPLDIWKISIDSYHEKKTWLEKMLETDTFSAISKWIIELSQKIDSTPLEIMLDTIIGSPNSQTKIDLKSDYKSLIYNYYFGQQIIDNKPIDYIIYLESLRTIRNKLRAYQENSNSSFNTLRTFCSYIESLKQSDQTIVLASREFEKSSGKINLLTAHKSKGLEFNYVFIIDAIDQVWGTKARGKNNLITYPENMKISYGSNDYEERLKLFFVAATRAKDYLSVNFSGKNDQDKDTAIASFLNDAGVEPTIINVVSDNDSLIENALTNWHDNLVTSNIATSIKDALEVTLNHYMLSITHINNFLNITKGGPQYFLTSNLLRFPEAMSPSSSYGSAIHQTMQYIHNYYASKGNKPDDSDIDSNYTYFLKQKRLIDRDFGRFLPRGIEAIHNFLDKNDVLLPKQKTELRFTNQNSIVGEARLNGALDVVDIDEDKNMIITDYKTGKPARSWKGTTDYEKIKLHQYRQQLLFYKLLVSHSKDYSKYTVKKAYLKFIEPDENKDVYSLETDYSTEDMERFTTLIKSIWDMIINLSFPSIEKYDKSFKGIIDFENDIIDQNI
jgi:DNA helicase-2/ATP-dependent DNA helicase PcrA